MTTRPPAVGPRRDGAARVALVAVAAVVAMLVTAGPAEASRAPDFEAPFPCGQRWSAETRAGHSPSWYSVDFNRDDDYRAPVLSSAPGVVTTVADAGGTSYGKYVIVDHGRGWTTLFAHLDEEWVVQGQRVDQGHVIGLLGTSGGSTGPHLHYEQRLDRVDQPAVFHGKALVYNTEIKSRSCGDVPVVGDWNGDERTDLGVYRRAAAAKFRLRAPDATPIDTPLGTAAVDPLSGDWNGNGVGDLGFWEPQTGTFSLRNVRGVVSTIPFGRHKDRPVTGDWDGDGRTDVGVFRPGRSAFRLRLPDRSTVRHRFGSVDSTPVTGDWDRDGDDDIGVFDSGNGVWVLRNGDGSTRTVAFGAPGSLPVVGDWNGNGITDLGVWSPQTATFSLRHGRGHKVHLVEWGRPR